MSPRKPEAQEAHRAQQRARLMTCARRCFALKGPVATRISEIVKEAGVSQGLLHHYFASKDELFVEIVRELMDAAVQVPAMAAAQPLPAVGQLRWYLELTVGGMLQQPESVLLIMHAQTEAAPEEARQLIATRGAEAFARLTEIVRAAQREGDVIDTSAEVIVAHLLAQVQGLALIGRRSLPDGAGDVGLLMRGIITQPKEAHDDDGH